MAGLDNAVRRLPLDDPDWLPVSALAAERGVSKQAVSERVAKFVAAGKLSTRGARRSLRVHAPTFRQLVAANSDPAQALRIRHVTPQKIAKAPALADEQAAPIAPSIEDAPAAPIAPSIEDAPADPPAREARQPSAYDDASTREKNAKAALAEIELAKRRGELVAVAEFEAAAMRVATQVAQTIQALRAQVTPLYAAAQRGEDALHTALNLAVDKTLQTIAADMASLASSTPDTPERE